MSDPTTTGGTDAANRADFDERLEAAVIAERQHITATYGDQATAALDAMLLAFADGHITNTQASAEIGAIRSGEWQVADRYRR